MRVSRDAGSLKSGTRFAAVKSRRERGAARIPCSINDISTVNVKIIDAKPVPAVGSRWAGAGTRRFHSPLAQVDLSFAPLRTGSSADNGLSSTG